MFLHNVAVLLGPALVALSGCSSSVAMGDIEAGGSIGVGDTAASPEPTELTAGAWDDNLNYDWFTDYLAEHSELEGIPKLDPEEREAAHARFSKTREAHDNLDISIVFDTTGSMGDELSYLTDALASIAEDIEQSAEEVDIRWSLVVYRDRGDRYVTRHIDFTRDLAAFQADLARQDVAGGGDYPEASDRALQEVVGLSWRTDPDTARLVFWFADAPHHKGRAGALTDALREAAQADVHLYPVAASGVDELAELTMRSAAQLTGGRYLFLTDDSGIGYSHKEPSIPCYYVTTLRHAMVRMVDIERTGVYVEPEPDQVIRTEGEPKDGLCVLQDDRQAIAF